MENRGSRLAARFRQAVSEQEQAKQQAEQQRALATAEAQRARAELLVELEAFGREIGVVRVARQGEALTLRYGERYVQFEPNGDQDRLSVTIEGVKDEELWLFRQPELGNRWVAVRRRRSREDRVPLFDQGLEDLLVRGLGLPAPTDP